MAEVIIKPDKDLKAFIYKVLAENNISKDVDDIEKQLYEELKNANKKKHRCMGFTDQALKDIILQIAGSSKKKQDNDEISSVMRPTEQAKAEKAEKEGKDYQVPLFL